MRYARRTIDHMTSNGATAALQATRDDLVRLRSDYQAALKEFSWPDVGPTFNFAHDWFDPMARGNHSPALVVAELDGDRTSYSFDEMAHRSDAVANLLATAGIRRGDNVIVMLGNQVELWETMLAVTKLGAVVIPTSTAVGSVELTDRVGRTSARAVVCNDSHTATFDAVPGDYQRVCVGDQVPKGWLRYRDAWNDIDAAAALEHPGNATTDPMLLYFTSGTTSRPKLVEHTHYSYPVGHLTTMYWIGLSPGDVHLNVSSPGWAKHAWSSYFAPWLAGATIVALNYSRFDADALLRFIRDESITSMCAPPTVWRMLINADLSGGPGTLREIVSAGEPLNPEVIHQVEQAWGKTIRDGYGQTETTASIANSPGQDVQAGSMGRALPGVPVVLVDPVDGQAVEGVGEGEVCLDLSGEHRTLMVGYRDSEGTGEVSGDGYYHTGDIASRDERGYLRYVGRTDDVFKASDYKVSPFELESVLIEHPDVAEAAIVPAPDPVRLAVPKAYVMLVPGREQSAAVAESILAFARDHLPAYLRVRRVEFYELPKTISGKIRRVELRQRETELADDRVTTEYRYEDFFPRTDAT